MRILTTLLAAVLLAGCSLPKMIKTIEDVKLEVNPSTAGCVQGRKNGALRRATFNSTTARNTTTLGATPRYTTKRYAKHDKATLFNLTPRHTPPN